MPAFVQPPISDYALIGNGRSAALISKSGSIDWLCLPRFDSPSLFGRLLDPKAGYWSITPVGPCSVTRRYLDNSIVLETLFQTNTGVLRLVDAMPIQPSTKDEMTPEHELLRIAECKQGEVTFAMTYAPRPDYARSEPSIKRRTPSGVALDARGGFVLLRSNHAIPNLNPQEKAWSEHKLHQGEFACFSLVFASESPAVIPPVDEKAMKRMQETAVQWQDWANRAEYNGPFRKEVIRSALVLKSLLFAPSGAAVAAPTTSLPERIGGDLNWDYRFCWLRDASLTTRALSGLGYHEEASAFLTWLLHTTRLTRPQLRVLYDVYGRLSRKEIILGHLRGYRDSRPVRIGNAAWEQLQLDVYGEVINATVREFHRGRKLDNETMNMLMQFGKYVSSHWHLPDEGVWEPRHPRQIHTHSLLLSWTALQRLCELLKLGPVKKQMDLPLFRREREEIRKVIEGTAWNPALASYTQIPGEDLVDASSYLFPWFGFEPATSERMRSTFKALERTLVAKSGLVYRYQRSFAKAEGAFGICCFWRIGYLAMAGRRDEAAEAFAKVIGFANDVGLLGEQIDETTGEALGNFPQAFTHIGLINAALTLWPNHTKLKKGSS